MKFLGSIGWNKDSLNLWLIGALSSILNTEIQGEKPLDFDNQKLISKIYIYHTLFRALITVLFIGFQNLACRFGSI